MAKLTSRRMLRELQVMSHECARCARVHHGGGTPPGWGHAPGRGLICDDCSDQLNVAKVTGPRRSRRQVPCHA